MEAKLIEELRENLVAPQMRLGVFSVESFIKRISGQAFLEDRDIRLLDRLAKKPDVTKVVDAFYSEDFGKLSDGGTIRSEYVVMLVAQLLRVSEQYSDPKFLNTALKILGGNLGPGISNFPIELKLWANQLLDAVGRLVHRLPNEKNVLDLTVLVFDGPVAKSYLFYLAKLGLFPRSIVKVHIDSPNRSFQLVKRVLGHRIANTLLQTYSRKYTPRAKVYCKEIMHEMGPIPNFFDRFDYTKYCESVEEVYCQNLNSTVVEKAISRQPTSLVLYTGGGIVSERLLSIPRKKFLHVHPGIVPEVKGSDGLFWSLLIRRKPGYSCFYMDSGIDTGSVLYKREFSFPTITSISSLKSIDIYNLLIRFYDPILRGKTFAEFMSSTRNGDISELQAISQKPDEGRTFYYMHSSLRSAVIDSLRS